MHMIIMRMAQLKMFLPKFKHKHHKSVKIICLHPRVHPGYFKISLAAVERIIEWGYLYVDDTCKLGCCKLQSLCTQGTLYQLDCVFKFIFCLFAFNTNVNLYLSVLNVWLDAKFLSDMKMSQMSCTDSTAAFTTLYENF